MSCTGVGLRPCGGLIPHLVCGVLRVFTRCQDFCGLPVHAPAVCPCPGGPLINEQRSTGWLAVKIKIGKTTVTRDQRGRYHSGHCVISVEEDVVFRLEWLAGPTSSLSFTARCIKTILMEEPLGKAHANLQFHLGPVENKVQLRPTSGHVPRSPDPRGHQSHAIPEPSKFSSLQIAQSSAQLTGQSWMVPYLQQDKC